MKQSEKIMQAIKKGQQGKKARVLLRIPQWRVAKACNCSLNRVYRWEMGQVEDLNMDLYYLNLRLQLSQLKRTINEKTVQSIEPRTDIRQDK